MGSKKERKNKKTKRKSKMNAESNWKISLQLSGFGFFSSVASFACHQKKMKICTCLHIDTIEKSDSCFSDFFGATYTAQGEMQSSCAVLALFSLFSFLYREHDNAY